MNRPARDELYKRFQRFRIVAVLLDSLPERLIFYSCPFTRYLPCLLPWEVFLTEVPRLADVPCSTCNLTLYFGGNEVFLNPLVVISPELDSFNQSISFLFCPYDAFIGNVLDFWNRTDLFLLLISQFRNHDPNRYECSLREIFLANNFRICAHFFDCFYKPFNIGLRPRYFSPYFAPDHLLDFLITL